MRKDFFISRAGADKALAVQIADIVRRAGFTTWLEDEDFGHASFMARIGEGYASCARMIALLSRHYQQSPHCKAEYEYTLADDRQNDQERLLVFCIEEVTAIEHLKNITYTDLVPVLNDASALERAVRVAIGVERPSVEASLYRPRQPIIHPAVSAFAGFTGREVEFEKIDRVLFGSADRACTAAALTDARVGSTTLQGLGGVGKSVLARHYAWMRRDRFCGIWWLRAETIETLEEDLLLLGDRFIPGVDTLPKREQAIQSVLDELDRQGSVNSGKPWLLIYDNVERPQHITRCLPRHGAHILITSRWTDWHPQATELPIEAFPPETALCYLLERARNEDPETAASLARTLGYLPLALDHARTYCWQARIRFADYQARVSDLIT